MRFISQPAMIVPFILWSVVWKGLALWKSAGKRQLVWFVVILLFNTVGILEIAYIFFLNKYDIDKGKLLSFLENTFKKQVKQ